MHLHFNFQLVCKRSLRVALCILPSPYGAAKHVYIHIVLNVTSIFSTDGVFSKTHKFDFTALSGRSCDSVSLPLSAIHDPFTDTVFSVAIVHQDQPPFDLGPLPTASLTVKALKGMKFESLNGDSIAMLPKLLAANSYSSNFFSV